MSPHSLEEYYERYFKCIHPPPSEMLRSYYDAFPFSPAYDKAIVNAEDFFSELMPKILADQKNWRRDPPALNIWEGIGVGNKELRHCAILSWLLTPKGNHCQGAGFFLALLQVIGETSLMCLAEPGFYTVAQEDDYQDHGRIDITLSSKDFVFVLEVKIDAVEQPDQLDRYREVLELKRKCLELQEDRCKIAFLTRDGRRGQTDQDHITISWGQVAEACDHFALNCGSIFISSLCRQYAEFIRSHF